jgi:succinyl-diaminopimelate desuccinylase
MAKIDPVELTANLIRCPSVAPQEGGALSLLQGILSKQGFTCTRIKREGVDNLFARWGDRRNGRSFGFNGHTDVVPVGDLAKWSVDPFGAEVKDGFLYGRGAVDMKSGVAAFVAAAIEFVNDTPPDGSVVIAITGDEEGEADHGTTAILDWMRQSGEQLDHCLVGEPTCSDNFGDMMKIGRRGSLTAFFTATGIQGHSAYPHRAKNPLTALVRLMDVFCQHELDDATEHFDQSTLAVTTIDTGNTANNVIPAQTNATVNIRFNDRHSGESLSNWLHQEAQNVFEKTGINISVKIKVSGESFIIPPGDLSALISKSVKAETGQSPKLSTTGGTSDARFIKDFCPVVEFGLVGKTMHSVDERVEISQILQLKSVYGRILQDYFG